MGRANPGQRHQGGLNPTDIGATIPLQREPAFGALP
jgi:hypothetical protein